MSAKSTPTIEAHGEICATDPCTGCLIGRRIAAREFTKRSHHGARKYGAGWRNVEIHISESELAALCAAAALAAIAKARGE